MTNRTAHGSRSRQEDVGIGPWRKGSSTCEQGIAFEDLMEIRLESEALQETSSSREEWLHQQVRHVTAPDRNRRHAKHSA